MGHLFTTLKEGLLQPRSACHAYKIKKAGAPLDRCAGLTWGYKAWWRLFQSEYVLFRSQADEMLNLPDDNVTKLFFVLSVWERSWSSPLYYSTAE